MNLINRLSWIIIIKIFISIIIVTSIPYIICYIIPSYNGENVYFPIKQRNEEKQNNDYRLKVIRKILDEYDWDKFNNKKLLNLTITIIVSNRNDKYFTQSIGYLLKEVEKLDAKPLILICNVEPIIFDELHFFKDKIDIKNINRYKNLTKYDINQTSGRIQKESNDYWTCLNHSYSFSSSLINHGYVLLLEDDAIIVPSFFILINSLIKQLETKELEYIDYVKLYHPWKLRKIPFIFQASSFSSLISIIIVVLLFKRFSIPLILLLTIICYINFKYINYEIFADLRYHLTSSAYIVPPESCCTPAVLFRGSSIRDMVNELSTVKTGDNHAKDHVLDESKYYGRGTDFNYVVHIGHFSSIRQKSIPLESLSKKHFFNL